MQNTLETSKFVLIKKDVPKEIIDMILAKSKEGFNYNSYSESFPQFNIEKYREKLPLDTNLENFKRKFVNYLIRLGTHSEREYFIRKIINWIYFKINHKSNFIFPPEIIKAFQNMKLDEFKEVYYYKIFFKSILNLSLNEKLEYLKANSFDFYDWIIKELRNKFVHELNIFYVETTDGLCGAKIITGKKRNMIFTIDEYFKSLCKLKALTGFLYNHLFRIEQNNSSKYTLYRISNVKLMKILRKNKYNFPLI